MTMTRTPRVLFVDDNVNLLNGARRISRGKLDMITAESAAEALDILNTDTSIEIVVSDQNMPAMKGVEFLAEVARRWPLIVRIMQTGNDDQATAMAAINAGQVFRFVRKPYESGELLQVIADAAALYAMRASEKRLLETTLAGSVKLMTELMTLTRPDLFQKSSRVLALAKQVAGAITVPHRWELELAIMLYPLGLVTIPEALSARYATHSSLTPQEQALIEQSPQVSANLLRNIPRLENVARIVGLSRRGFDGSGHPADGPKGTDLPVGSRLLHILIDAVDLAETKQISNAEAIASLRSSSRRYDPQMLTLIADTITLEVAASPDTPMVEEEVLIIMLNTGDRVARDVRSDDNKLLLSIGSILTEVTIQRLRQFAQAGHCEDRLWVIRPATEAVRKAS